jgi:putative transposase
MVKLALRLQYTLVREDLTGLIEALRRLPKNHRVKLIIMRYSRLGRWIDWQAMKHGTILAIIDPRGTSLECLQCGSKLEENGYRRLRYSQCNFEAYRDVVRKLNIWKRTLKMLGIKAILGGALTTSLPLDDRCKLE